MRGAGKQPALLLIAQRPISITITEMELSERMTALVTETLHRYIEKNPAICSGKAIIGGTRLTVTQIAIEYDRLGWTADEIVEAHPHLELAQVHDALSYYYENREDLDAEIRDEEALVNQLRAIYPSKLAAVYRDSPIHE